LNGAYFINIIKKITNNEILISNLGSVGKKKVKTIQTNIEQRFIYQLVRGENIKKWSVCSSGYILIPQNPEKPGRGYPLSEMKINYPLTYSYFEQFKDDLVERSGYKKFLKPSGDPFYSLYNIGPYTFSRYKVVWTRVSNRLSAGVISPSNTDYTETDIVIPIETATLVPFNDEIESHYFCAMINSSIADIIVRSYSSKGTGSFGSPHILKHISILKFDKKNNTHVTLAILSKECHKAATKGDSELLFKLELEIDKAVAKLLEIPDDELEAIRTALKDVDKPKPRKNNIQKKSPIWDKEELNTKKVDNKFNHKSLHLQDKLSPGDLMHLSHKAKYNNVLTPKQRGALFKISNLKSRGYNLSQKQVNYLESILKEAIDQGLLEAKCNHHECEICSGLQDVFKK
jgi:hypothetical protein